MTTKITCDANKTGALQQSDWTITAPDAFCTFIIEASHAAGCPLPENPHLETVYGGPNVAPTDIGYFTQK